MATGHFFKTSADVGAPQLRNVAGDLIAVLDFLLDVATGTHWQKVFSATNKAVYRATTGHRYFLRVDDTGTTTAQIRAYGTMTSVDAGTNPFPTVAQKALTAMYFYKATNATPRAYRMVGDSRFFLMLGDPLTVVGSEQWPLMFGELSPTEATDTFCTGVMACDSTSGAPSNPGSIFGACVDQTLTTSRLYYARGVDGINVSHDGALQPMLPVGGQGGSMARSASPVFNAVRTWDYNQTGTAINGHVRALVPYLYAMPYTVDTSILDLDVSTPIGSSTYRAYRSITNGPYALLRTSNDEPGRA